MPKQRPIISFDLDGVLADPPFGWNPAINRDIALQPTSTNHALPTPSQSPDDSLTGHILRATWYRLRYVLRPPRQGALSCLRAAADTHDVIILTGRHERGRAQTQAWLERHGFAPHIDRLIMNATPLPSARYKEQTLTQIERNITLHADDDAATAALLARSGFHVALLDWPRNRGLSYPDGVERFDHMDQLRQTIETLETNP